MRDILQHWRWGAADIRAALAPTIPLHCADEFLCGCGALAKEFGAPLQSHVGESKLQALAGMQRYGRTLVAAARRAWFGRPRLLRRARHLADR